MRAIVVSKFIDNFNADSVKLVPLKDLCRTITKGTTPTTMGRSFTSSGINYVKAESITEDHSFDMGKFSHIDEETNKLLKRSIICPNDILFTIAGSLGRFAFVDSNILPANTNQAVAIIRADASKVSPEYLYSLFIGGWHQEFYNKRVQQAVQANLSLGTIKTLPIPILIGAEMEEFLQVITPILSLSKANEFENARLKDIRDALLPRLMAGEIDVSAVQL